MPLLLDLPIELLDRIVEETIPEDFEAVALSCKLLYSVSTHFLKKYNPRRKRFRNFAFSRKVNRSKAGWDHVSNDTGFVVPDSRELLERIAAEPELVRYIRAIDLKWPEEEEEEGYSDGSNGEENERNDESPAEPDERVPLSDTLKQLVYTYPLLQEFDQDLEDWIHAIELATHPADEDEAEVYAECLLLTMLSNLQKISLPRIWGHKMDPEDSRDSPGVKALEPILKYLVHRANNPEQFPDSPLSKLKIVNLTTGIGYEEKYALTAFTSFLAINSVSEVCLSNCIFKDDGYTGSTFQPLFNSYSHNLRKLELMASVAGPSELSELLLRIPNLQIFHFAHETKWHGCGHDWNVGAFFATVQEHCAETLQELSVCIIEQYGGQGTTLYDMTRFQKLSLLDMEIRMLCGPAYNPSLRHDEEEDLPKRSSWPRLVEMLPASIKKLNLYLNDFKDEKPDCLSHIFQGFKENREANLPHLQEVTLFSPIVKQPKPPANVRRALQAVGDSGVSIVETQNRWPSWVDDFFDRHGFDGVGE
ncbi:hypothetical protein BGW36DRAFT_457508 [Talaromyces proteolyticus]|uniref:F-box domain-containing protein n=1 Tax=Talaromyces proteolyticus TaxID=1131652 RepID=A0AAD4KYY5_9EURO|nr:uncharacterized protein BGW36DRAFT_457508 [Talaromyces proteolyticus]KAH8703178.1 hypothetical protein BGW36DRAFT_457508 [Talaromyces proteolyticus]